MIELLHFALLALALWCLDRGVQKALLRREVRRLRAEYELRQLRLRQHGLL